MRRSSQQEQENLWTQLRKARSSTDHSVSDQVPWTHTHTQRLPRRRCNESTLCFQMCQMQAELENEWKAKCHQMLASAREQHSSELAELRDQRDLLQNKLRELQEKVRC